MAMTKTKKAKTKKPRDVLAPLSLVQAAGFSRDEITTAEDIATGKFMAAADQLVHLYGCRDKAARAKTMHIAAALFCAAKTSSTLEAAKILVRAGI